MKSSIRPPSLILMIIFSIRPGHVLSSEREVNVSSVGAAKDIQSYSMGMYTYTGEHNGYPFFQKVNPVVTEDSVKQTRYLYVDDDNNWAISRYIQTPAVNLYNIKPATQCAILGGKIICDFGSTWQYYTTDGFKIDEGLRLNHYGISTETPTAAEAEIRSKNDAPSLKEPEVVLLIGGWRESTTGDYIWMRSVEVFGQDWCSPNLTLPDDRLGPTSHYINGHILVCGGSLNPSCLQLVGGEFKNHSQLNEDREKHSGVILNGNLFIMGGIYKSMQSMEILNGTTWTLSKNKLEHGTDVDRSCVVALSNTRAMVIGGLKDGWSRTKDAVSIYDTEGGWITIKSMPEGRFGHSCMVLENDEVLVAGGTLGGGKLYTAIVYNGDFWGKLPGKLNTARSFGQMVKLNGRILYFGGQGGIDVNFKTLDTVEEFDKDMGTWTLLKQTMEIPRMDFSAVVVPASAVGCHLSANKGF